MSRAREAPRRSDARPNRSDRFLIGFATRDRALIAHATQVDPTGRWFACPIGLQQEAWPTEDYELARSHVDSVLPEDDLFAGIRARVDA